jgi:aspartyl aminopeptidase
MELFISFVHSSSSSYHYAQESHRVLEEATHEQEELQKRWHFNGKSLLGTFAMANSSLLYSRFQQLSSRSAKG